GLEDRAMVGRLLNNLGGLNFTLGNAERAVELLENSYRVSLEVGDEPEAGMAMCSLAQTQLELGEPTNAEEKARSALDLFGGRVDYLQGIGIAQLVLGRSLLEQD